MRSGSGMRRAQVHSRRWNMREPRCAQNGSPASSAMATAPSATTGSASDGSAVAAGSGAATGSGDGGGIDLVDPEIRLDGGPELVAGAAELSHRAPDHAPELRKLRRA